MNLGVILRAPISRRAWADLAYVLVNVPLSALGFAYVVGTLVLGAGLAVTAAGVPLLAAGLVGARRIGGLHRRLAGRFLGERIEAPARPVPPPGLLGRMQARFSDPVGWRAMGYLLLKPPVAALQLYVLALTWAWGVVAATRPLQNALGLNQGVPPAGVGYLLKERVGEIDDFVDALHRVASGGTALDPEVVGHLLNAGRGGVRSLTPREREVLGLMAEGRTNAAIAKALVVSDRAVEKHIANIFLKLDLPPSGDDHRRVLAVLRYLGV
jgi:DNA-binding CsgD family transcriptional regulator